MRVRVGPILHLRQPTETEWRFSVGLWLDALQNPGPQLTFDPGARAVVGTLTQRGTFDGGEWVAWDVSIPRQATELRTSYTIGGIAGGDVVVDHVVIPAKGQAPRLAFFSCNGVEDARRWTNQPEMERLWPRMLDRHRAPASSTGAGGAYHVLVGGGDQIYCDGIWQTSRLKEYDSWAKRKKARVTPQLHAYLEAAYAKMYERWSASAFAELHRRVPGIYTWDDHDIFDGWGSYGDGIETAPLPRAIFETARRAFTLFQLGGVGRPHEPLLTSAGSHYLQAVRFDDAFDLVLLDLRSQRTPRGVMEQDQWAALHGYLSQCIASNRPPAHLLVVSSIPLVYLNFAAAEGLLGLVPWRQSLEDDLRDQWESPAHQEERARLIMTLLDHARAAGTRVTVLSGDVHVGARGQIVSRRPEHLQGAETAATIHQLTSSAIVFPPPGAFELAGMRAITRAGPEPLLAVSNVETAVVPVTPSHDFVSANNWLSIEPDAAWAKSRRRLWARWLVERGEITPPLLIHPR